MSSGSLLKVGRSKKDLLELLEIDLSRWGKRSTRKKEKMNETNVIMDEFGRFAKVSLE